VYLKRVLLKNVGPHALLDVSFQQGLVAICGPNGSGKSTLLDASYAALTNDWGRFDGEKTDSVHALAEDKEESSVLVEAQHGEASFSVLRGLRPARHRLTYVGRKDPINGDAAVREELTRLLGVERGVLSAYVFVRQKGMYDFLDQTPAVRAQAFANLCRTTQAQAAYEACGKALRALEAEAAPLADDADDLARRVAAATAELEEVFKAQQRYDAAILSEADVAYGTKVLADTARRQSLESSVAAVKERLAQAVKAAEMQQSLVAKLEKQCGDLAAAVESMRPAAEEATRVLAEFARYQKANDLCERVEAELAALERELAAQAEPRPPCWRIEDLSVMREEVAQTQAEFRAARETVRLFEAEGVVECPTCHTRVEELTAHLQKARDLVERGDAWIRQKTFQIHDEEAYREKHAQWLARCQTLQGRLTEKQNSLAGLRETVGPRPEGDRAELEQRVQDFKAPKAAHALHKQKLGEAQTALAAADARREAAYGEHERLNAEAAATKRPEDEIQLARRLMAAHRTAEVELAALAEREKAARRTLQDAQERAERLRVLRRRTYRRQRASIVLRRLRDEVFHHTRLPLTVAQGNLAILEADLNETLEQFGGPFWTQADENLGYLVHFPGQPPRRAERLSGGQKGVFATAFRAALATLEAADVGLLCLDEPTDGLDADNLAFLREALGRLAARVRGRRQVIVVTHATELLPAFDQVVQL